MWCWWPTHQLHKVTSVSTITVYDNSIHRTHYVAKASLRVPVSAGKWVFYFLSSNKKKIYTGFLQQQNQTHPIQLYTEKKRTKIWTWCIEMQMNGSVFVVVVVEFHLKSFKLFNKNFLDTSTDLVNASQPSVQCYLNSPNEPTAIESTSSFCFSLHLSFILSISTFIFAPHKLIEVF